MKYNEKAAKKAVKKRLIGEILALLQTNHNYRVSAILVLDNGLFITLVPKVL